MAATKEQIEAFVRDAYPHNFESGLQEQDGEIFGYVRSSDFLGKEYRDRLREFRDRLNSRFGQHMINIGIISPLAPGESLDRR